MGAVSLPESRVPARFVHAGSGARHIAARFAGGVGLWGQGDGRAEGGPAAARLGHAPLAAAPEEGPRLRRLAPPKALGARQLGGRKKMMPLLFFVHALLLTQPPFGSSYITNTLMHPKPASQSNMSSVSSFHFIFSHILVSFPYDLCISSHIPRKRSRRMTARSARHDTT